MLIDFFHAASSGNAWLSIADAVLKATILLGAAAVSAYALRGASAAARHLVWTLALLSALILPALSIALPRWQLPIVTLSSTEMAPATPNTVEAASAPVTGTFDGPAAVAPSRGRRPTLPAAAAEGQVSRIALPNISWPAALLLVWAAGALTILGRLGVGLLAVQWTSRRTQRVTNAADAPWFPLARDLAAGLGITPRIAFLRSATASMPMAWGIVRPSVLMPADADGWPAERVRIVLLHELAHVKRRDCLTHVLAQVSCALYWFNPLAWIAARHVRTERERACDDLVLAAGTDGPDYANQLLEIARVMRAGRFPGVLAGASLAMAYRSQLEGRLMAILDPTVPRAGVTRLRTICASALLAVALMPLSSMQPWAYAAAPDSGKPEVTASAGPAQAPTPAPRPAPTTRPTPAPVADGVIDSAVHGAVRSAIPGAVQGAIEGGITGALQGIVPEVAHSAVTEALADLSVNSNIDLSQEVKEKARGADPKVVSALTAALKDGDEDVRETAMHALVQMRDPAIFDPLLQALNDQNAGVREQAAFGLGQLKDRRAVAPLTNALKDTNASVREQAAFALGQLRDRSAVPALSAALKDEAEGVREQVVFALGQMRDPSSVDGLTIALRDTKPNVREQAAFALGQIRDRRAVEPLTSALKDADDDVREQAAFGLGQIRDRAAVEALVVALKDKAANVREQAAFALGQLRDPRAIDGLTDALKDSSADVRQQAAFALGQIAR
jgi:HEAT repeat protein/beta-lactamase regulating signal transducer with metallopeptidase domain